MAYDGDIGHGANFGISMVLLVWGLRRYDGFMGSKLREMCCLLALKLLANPTSPGGNGTIPIVLYPLTYMMARWPAGAGLYASGC